MGGGRTYALRQCERCGSTYRPTGPRQKFCEHCRPTYSEAGVNALRVAILKQAKKDGKLERMVETGAAAKLFPGTDQAYLERLAKEEKACVTQTIPSSTSSDGTPSSQEPSNGSPSADAAESTSSRTMPSGSEETGSAIAASTECEKPLERRNGMKNFEEVYSFNIWDELKAGKNVIAVDLERTTITDLEDCSVGEVVTILKHENTVYFMRKEATE